MNNDLTKEYVSAQSFVIGIPRKVSLKRAHSRLSLKLYMMRWIIAYLFSNNMVKLYFGVNLGSQV